MEVLDLAETTGMGAGYPWRDIHRLGWQLLKVMRKLTRSVIIQP